MSDQEIFTIDGKEYKVADLTDEGKACIESIKFVNEEIKQTEARLAVLNTAKAAYTASLKNEMVDTIN